MKLAKAYLILHMNGRRIVYNLGNNDIQINIDDGLVVPVSLKSERKTIFKCEGILEETMFYYIRSKKGKQPWNKFLRGLKI